MKIFLVGVACIGKSTIGRHLAEKLGYVFFDFDTELEMFYGKSIPRLKAEILTEYSFRADVGSKVLKKIIEENETNNYVVALPPSGLNAPYVRIVRSIDSITVVLEDTPQNILNRATFYDDDSNVIEKQLTDEERKMYLREIKKDITYYKRPYQKANYHVDISGLDAAQSAEKLAEILNAADSGEPKCGR